MKEIARLKAAMKNDPVTAKLIVPSAINEIYIDLDGDGKADFAFIGSTESDEIDTFAFDTTTNGEFNLYISDTDNNGVEDDIRFFLDGSDVPAEIFKGDKVENKLSDLSQALHQTLKDDFDAKALINAVETYKNGIFKAFESFQVSATFTSLKHILMENPAIASTILPSTKHELLVDLDGDGKPDFALIDSNWTNRIDTYAFDITGNGELNLYIRDTDNNRIPDEVHFYPDGADTPEKSFLGSEVELRMVKATIKFIAAMRGSLDPVKYIKAIQTYKDEVFEAYKNLAGNGSEG